MLCICVIAAPLTASAQVSEVVGSRAAGMGGAFVAVANDSTATWWNPAGLAAGPFFDMVLARAAVEVSSDVSRTAMWQNRTSWFALGTPPFGVSYYRFRLTDIRPFSSTGPTLPDREERGAGVPIRSLAASQLGVTLVQTVFPGVHTGATLKYLRGAFDGGDAENQLDVDLGVLATAGAFRLGVRLRNVLEPAIGTVRLERQTRVGVAFEAEAAGGAPLTIALDADVDAYEIGSAARRVVALGAERWLWDRRVGLRAGGRMNTVGGRERSATAGASVALRTGVYVDGHVVRGGAADEEGWGVAARVTF